MFQFSLLAEVSQETTDIVTWVSIGVLAVLFIVLAVLCFANRKYTAKEIAYAGICIALSFALSFIKIAPVQFGGSITLASFAPILIYSYKCGVLKGTLAGAIFGLLNFISGPYILTPLTFVLDYILAFASIGIMGFALKFGKLSVCAKVTIGTVMVYVVRFIFHLISGFIYFAEQAIWVDLPADNMFLYSFVYQCVYLPADCVLCIIVLVVLAKTKVLDKLLNMMSEKKKTAEAVPEDGEIATAVEDGQTPEGLQTTEQTPQSEITSNN